MKPAVFAHRSGLAPIVSRDSEILILGSLPGEESLRRREYYGHPRNQFWQVLASLVGAKVPANYTAKKALLKRARVAVWDVLKTCRRNGSSDASIKHAAVNDIPGLLRQYPKIRRILLNGKTAERYFTKTIGHRAGVPFAGVPSTSPAHAGMSVGRKADVWRKAIKC